MKKSMLMMSVMFVGFNANAFTRVYSCDSVNLITNQRVLGFSNSVEIEVSDTQKDTVNSIGTSANVYKNIRPGIKKKLTYRLLLWSGGSKTVAYRSSVELKDENVLFLIDKKTDVGTLSFDLKPFSNEPTQSFLCGRES